MPKGFNWVSTTGGARSGAKNSYFATLVERQSRFALLVKVASKDTEAVVAALKSTGS